AEKRGLAHGEVDGAHAAVAERPEHPVRPDEAVEEGVRWISEAAVAGGAGGFAEEAGGRPGEKGAGLGLGVGGEEGFNLAAERRVVGTGGVEEGGALVRRVHPGGAEEAFEPVEGIGGHGWGRSGRQEARRDGINPSVPPRLRSLQAASSRRSQARAIAQSFETVPCETPTASAVSSMESPAK